MGVSRNHSAAFVTPVPVVGGRNVAGGVKVCARRNEMKMGVWDGVKKVVHAGALSLAVLSLPIEPRHVQAATVRDTSANGDVEAAAMTLGAVTVGGLIMRAIIKSGRDEEKERRKLEEECKRLEMEEMERLRREERRKMESVSDELVDEFMERVRGLEKEEKERDWGGKGMGSAVLERPEEEEKEKEGKKGDVGQKDVDMLRRMWDLSNDDDKKGKK